MNPLTRRRAAHNREQRPTRPHPQPMKTNPNCVCGQPKDPRLLLCRDGWQATPKDEQKRYLYCANPKKKRELAHWLEQAHLDHVRVAQLDGTAAAARQRDHVAATYTLPLGHPQPSSPAAGRPGPAALPPSARAAL